MIKKANIFPIVDKEWLQRKVSLGPRYYGSGAVQKMLDIPARTMLHWADLNMVSPEGAKAHGKGTRRYFTVKNVVQFAILQDMSRMGWRVDLMQKVLDHLTQAGYFENLHNPKRDHEAAFVYINEKDEIGIENGTPVDMPDSRITVKMDLAMIELWVSEALENVLP